MTTEDMSPKDSCSGEIELDILKNEFGGISVWDSLINRHGEPVVGIGRQVFEVPDDSDEIRYQFGVATEYYELERQGAYGINGVGFQSGKKRQLREAMRNIADQHSVTKERIRQACTSAYDTQEKELIEQFLDDLKQFQDCLNQWYEQNSQ